MRRITLTTVITLALALALAYAAGSYVTQQLRQAGEALQDHVEQQASLQAYSLQGPARYVLVSGSGPRHLVVRGAGCLQAEDSLRLRVLAYDPPQRVVYRCLQP